jgi:hypothetical protein
VNPHFPTLKDDTMARTLLFHQLGGPEVMTLEDVEVGEPGPGEARIRVDAFCLNTTWAYSWIRADRKDGLDPADQERAPGRPGPPGCGIDAGILEDLPHRRRGELIPQAGDLAVDAPVPPDKY